jgi:tocopherol O-methyltransferase
MQFDTNSIIQYYNRTEWVYKNYWSLDKSLGLHFGFWHSKTKKLPEAILYQNEWMANKVGIANGLHILDAGCGIGGSSINLAQLYNCSVTGISISPKQVTAATQNAVKAGVSDRVQFFERDFIDTKFNNESFDIVWAIESVCHAQIKNDFFKEAFRVLKKGGKLIIADYFQTKNTLTEKENNLLYTKGINGWAVGCICIYKEFEQSSAELGFEKTEWINVNKLVHPSVKKLLQKTRTWLIPGYLYFKLGGITDTEYYNALGTYHFCKQFEKLWNYEVFIATKK